MNIRTNLNDRKELAKRLVPFNRGEKLHYTGTAGFCFEGYGFRILRSGEIECDDDEARESLMSFLESEGLVERDSTTLEINIPIDGMDGFQLRNLVFSIKSQQYLINRAAGYENFNIAPECIEALKEAELIGRDSFFKAYSAFQSGNKGISFSETYIKFSFRDTADSIKNRALIELFTFMVSAARKAKRVQPIEKRPENEKYYFRSWLIRIGMGTKASHESRMALLKDLSGWSAFRTEDEARCHTERLKARKNQEN